jgi:HEAT repeat protein
MDHSKERSDFAYLDRVQRATKLLEELGADFDPIDEPDNPAWKELSSWGAESVETLLGAAWSSDHLLVAAVNALGWRRDKNAVLPLAEILDQLDEHNFEDHLEWLFTAATVVDALGRIGDTRALPALNKLLAGLLGVSEKELEKGQTAANLADSIMAIRTEDDNELLYSSLLDAYDAFGKDSAVPVSYLLTLPYTYLIDQSLDVLRNWNALPDRRVLEIIAKRGNKRARALLGS